MDSPAPHRPANAENIPDALDVDPSPDFPKKSDLGGGSRVSNPNSNNLMGLSFGDTQNLEPSPQNPSSFQVASGSVWDELVALPGGVDDREHQPDFEHTCHPVARPPTPRPSLGFMEVDYAQKVGGLGALSPDLAAELGRQDSLKRGHPAGYADDDDQMKRLKAQGLRRPIPKELLWQVQQAQRSVQPDYREYLGSSQPSPSLVRESPSLSQGYEQARPSFEAAQQVNLPLNPSYLPPQQGFATPNTGYESALQVYVPKGQARVPGTGTERRETRYLFPPQGYAPYKPPRQLAEERGQVLPSIPEQRGSQSQGFVGPNSQSQGYVAPHVAEQLNPGLQGGSQVGNTQGQSQGSHGHGDGPSNPGQEANLQNLTSQGATQAELPSLEVIGRAGVGDKPVATNEGSESPKEKEVVEGERMELDASESGASKKTRKTTKPKKDDKKEKKPKKSRKKDESNAGSESPKAKARKPKSKKDSESVKRSGKRPRAPSEGGSELMELDSSEDGDQGHLELPGEAFGESPRLSQQINPTLTQPEPDLTARASTVEPVIFTPRSFGTRSGTVRLDSEPECEVVGELSTACLNVDDREWEALVDLTGDDPFEGVLELELERAPRRTQAEDRTARASTVEVDDSGLSDFEELPFPELKREGFGRSVPEEDRLASSYPELYERTRCFPGYRNVGAQLEAPLEYDPGSRNRGLYHDRLDLLFRPRTSIRDYNALPYLDKFMGEVDKLNIVSHETNEYLRRLLALKYEIVSTNPHVRSLVGSMLRTVNPKYAFTTVLNQINSEVSKRVNDTSIDYLQLFSLVQGFFRCQGDRFRVLVDLVNALDLCDFFHVWSFLVKTTNDLVFMLEKLDARTKNRTFKMIEHLRNVVRDPNPIGGCKTSMVMVALDDIIAEDVARGRHAKFTHLFFRNNDREGLGFFHDCGDFVRNAMNQSFVKAVMRLEQDRPKDQKRVFMVDGRIGLGEGVLPPCAHCRATPPIARTFKPAGGTGLFLRDRQNLLQKSLVLWRRYYEFRDKILDTDLVVLQGKTLLCGDKVQLERLFNNLYTAAFDLVKVEIMLDHDDTVTFKHALLTGVPGMLQLVEGHVASLGVEYEAGFAAFRGDLARVSEYRNNSARMTFIHKLERLVSDNGRLTDSQRVYRLHILKEMTGLVDGVIARYRQVDPSVCINENEPMAEDINRVLRTYLERLNGAIDASESGYLVEFGNESQPADVVPAPPRRARPAPFLGGRLASLTPRNS